jgi:hypothetical protein
VHTRRQRAQRRSMVCSPPAVRPSDAQPTQPRHSLAIDRTASSNVGLSQRFGRTRPWLDSSKRSFGRGDYEGLTSGGSTRCGCEPAGGETVCAGARGPARKRGPRTQSDHNPERQRARRRFYAYGTTHAVRM